MSGLGGAVCGIIPVPVANWAAGMGCSAVTKAVVDVLDLSENIGSEMTFWAWDEKNHGSWTDIPQIFTGIAGTYDASLDDVTKAAPRIHGMHIP